MQVFVNVCASFCVCVLKTRGVPGIVKPVLKDEEVLKSLSDLHSKFVVVPIDKASNNVAIICKRYYIQKLLNEVGVPGNAQGCICIFQFEPENDCRKSFAKNPKKMTSWRRALAL